MSNLTGYFALFPTAYNAVSAIIVFYISRPQANQPQLPKGNQRHHVMSTVILIKTKLHKYESPPKCTHMH